MKASSQDVRERALRAVDLGRPRAEILQLLGISSATLKRYIKRQREEGHVRPKAIPGRPRRNGHRERRACCLNCRRMPTRHWNNTVTCGSRRTVNG
jgi:transposase